MKVHGNRTVRVKPVETSFPDKVDEIIPMIRESFNEGKVLLFNLRFTLSI